MVDLKNCKEWIVEAMLHNGRFACVGKVLTDVNLMNEDDLDDIWDMANWSVNGRDVYTLQEGLYAGFKAMETSKFVYVIMKTDLGIVNDNILVRKHYNTTQGYYMKSSRIHKDMKRDEWCFGAYDEALREYRSNPFIVSHKL